FPYTTLFRSIEDAGLAAGVVPDQHREATEPKLRRAMRFELVQVELLEHSSRLRTQGLGCVQVRPDPCRASAHEGSRLAFCDSHREGLREFRSHVKVSRTRSLANCYPSLACKPGRN